MAKKFKLNTRLGVKKKLNKAADIVVEKEPEKIRKMRRFVEHHKKMVLLTFMLFVAVVAATLGIINYNTAYEYSYNGHVLGVVKDKEDVLKITELVQNALTEEREVEVVIDKEQDIEFRRVSLIGSSIHIDTSEDVLRRMTYVGDINVKGYCITVDGTNTVILDSEESADAVLDDIKDDYVKTGDNIITEKAEFQENIKIKEVNTDLDNLQSKSEAKDTLLNDGVITSVYVVEEGESLEAIAEDHDMTLDRLKEINPDVSGSPEAGTEVKVESKGAMVTLEVTQLVTTSETIEHEVIEEKTDELYEGQTEVKEEGEDGKRVVTSKIETVNGKETLNMPIVEIVEKQPTTEVLLVGTAERPPSVGDGSYSWPAKSGTYRISSEYGWRWGRLHAGIDMACSVGTDVYASQGGIVTYAGYHPTYGYLVTIDHQNGCETRYAHNSKLLVSTGDEVFEGMHIAESGNTGRSTGPHIHFEVHWGGSAHNPREVLP